MVGQFLGVGFGHDLNEQGPAGEIALFDVLIEIALMAFTILGDNGFGFGVGQVLMPAASGNGISPRSVRCSR